MMNVKSKNTDDANLTQKDVFDLVCEYLSTKGFEETESTLKREMKRGDSQDKEPYVCLCVCMCVYLS